MSKSIKQVLTKPVAMNVLFKVHNQEVDGCPSFTPILSALQTPTYNLAKFLVPILNSLTRNGYKVKDSFHFAEEVCEQDSLLSMGSLGIDSFLCTFLMIKLLMFASISYLKTLILLNVSQNQKLNNCYVWLEKSPILYSMVYSPSKPMV